jgi:hypothetical protein
VESTGLFHIGGKLDRSGESPGAFPPPFHSSPEAPGVVPGADIPYPVAGSSTDPHSLLLLLFVIPIEKQTAVIPWTEDEDPQAVRHG